MTTEDSIRKFLSTVREGIRRDQREKGMESSGRSGASMHIESEQKKEKADGQLYAMAYMQQQITGRRPGRFPPIKAILEWINEQGIEPDDISKKSLAFLIARKIARKGTDIFQHKRPGIDLKGIVIAAEPEFKKDLIEGSKSKFRTDIMGAFKQAQRALVQ